MSEIVPGDVTIQKINLISSDGSKNITIKPQVKYISVYESVLSPVLYAEMILADAIDLLRGFPIIGEEKIELEFETPTLKPISLKMNVFQITDVNVGPDQKMKTYKLHLVSQEAFDNEGLFVNRKFTEENENNISNVMITDLKTTKPVTLAKTKGIDVQLITNQSPLQAIDKFRLRAVSLKYLSSSFVFYEDRNGFHFITLEEMIDNNKGKTSNKHFVYDASNIITDITKLQPRHIIGWKVLHDTNTISKIQSGTLRTDVISWDIISSDIVNYLTGNDPFASTGENSADGSSGFNREYGQTTARQFLVPYDSAGEETFIAEKIGPLHGFVDKITQNLVHCHIYGDSDIELGDLLGATISTGTGLTSDSGSASAGAETNYLVTKIRHILVNGNRPMYTQSLELVNNSYDY